MYEYNAIIDNVVDGDTFDLTVDLGFKIFHKIRVRLLDIDTPEVRGSKFNEEHEYGLICKNYAKLQYEGRSCVIRSKLNKDSSTDSFGRYLIYCFIDGQNLVDVYGSLGINKKSSTYSIEKIKQLELNYLSEVV